jgi:hypothetical protein
MHSNEASIPMGCPMLIFAATIQISIGYLHITAVHSLTYIAPYRRRVAEIASPDQRVDKTVATGDDCPPNKQQSTRVTGLPVPRQR